MPPLRLKVIDDLAANPGSTTSDVRRRVNKPWSTVDRQLQALHMLGVLEVEEAIRREDAMVLLTGQWHRTEGNRPKFPCQKCQYPPLAPKKRGIERGPEEGAPQYP